MLSLKSSYPKTTKKNRMLTAIDRAIKEHNESRATLLNQCNERLAEIQAKLIELSDEQDRCKDYKSRLQNDECFESSLKWESLQRK